MTISAACRGVEPGHVLGRVGLGAAEPLGLAEADSSPEERLPVAVDARLGMTAAQPIDEILGLFEQFNQVGVTVVLATHDAQLAQRLNPRIVHIRGGRMVE